MLPLTTFYRSGAHRSDVYKWDAFVTSWRFYNRTWQPQCHNHLPETSGTLWIHRGALTNHRCSLATRCGIMSVTKPPTPALPLLVLIQPPSPLLRYAPSSLLPPTPLHPGPGLQDPVNYTFCFGSLSTAYTGPVIHCPSLWPFRQSSILQTSVDPGLLITSAFYTPPVMFVTSWRFYNRTWQPQCHNHLPETSGTLWIHRGALTNHRCSLATRCGIMSVTKPPTPALPLLVLIQSPSPLLRYAPSSLLPPTPLHPGPGLQDPVNYTFCFGSLSTAYTGPVIHCPSLWPFRQSSILQTSVDPGLLITSAFLHSPCPQLPPPPRYTLPPGPTLPFRF